MKKAVKKVLLPITGFTALTLPLAAVISADTEGNTVVTFGGGATDEFTGSYVHNQYIDFTKTGPQNNLDPYYLPFTPSSDNYEFSDVNGTLSTYWTNGAGYFNAGWYHTLLTTNSLNPQKGPNSVASLGFNQVVNIVETTPGVNSDWNSSNVYYNMSKPKTRRWRATFNNFYPPKNPEQYTNVQNASQGITPDAFGNLRFGVSLTKDLQLVNNSLRVSVIYKNNNFELQPSNGQIGNSWEFIQDPNSQPTLSNYPVVMQANPNNPNEANNSWNLEQNFNTSVVTVDNNTEKSFQYNPPGYDWASNGYWNAYQLNNLWYKTIDDPSTSLQTVTDIQQGSGTGTPSQQYGWLQGSILPANSDPNSAYVKNLKNIGSVIYGQMSTGTWYYRNGATAPTVIMEFETTDNVNYSSANGSNPFVYDDKDTSGITAIMDFYRGQYNTSMDNNGNAVFSKSVNFKRSDYRTMKIQIEEYPASNQILQQNNIDTYFLPNAYSYELWWGDKYKIAEFPQEIINQGKGDTFKTAIKKGGKYTINLEFTTDVSKWPEEMKQMSSLNWMTSQYPNGTPISAFLDPTKLRLRRVNTDADLNSFFFSTDQQSGFTTKYLAAYPPQDGNLGGTYLDPFSMENDGVIRFESAVQWNFGDGYKKLTVLSEIVKARSVNGTAAGSGVLYPSFNFKNQALLQAQKDQFNEAVFNDWKAKDFNNDAWIGYLNTLMQADYNATQSDQTNSALYNPVIAYEAAPNDATNAVTKDFMSFNNYQQAVGSQTKDKISAYINYIFAPAEDQAKLKNALAALAKWKDVSTPSFVNNTVEDSNDSAKKIQDLVNATTEALNTLNAAYPGFENKNQTSAEFITEAFSKIDALTSFNNGYKTAFKDTVLKLTKRADVISYVQALVSLQQKISEAQSYYNKYVVVKGETYKNIHSTDSTSTYFAFTTKLDETEKLLNELTKIYSGNAQVDPAYSEKSIILNYNKQFDPVAIQTTYQAINVDILNAKAFINGLENISAQEKQWANNELDQILTSTNPDYKLLENYTLREAKIAIIAAAAKFENLVNSQKDNSLTKQYASIVKFTYTNSIDLNNLITVKQDDLTITTSNGTHPNLPYEVSEDKYYVYNIPNTTIASGSVNYWWQSAAKNLANGNNSYPKVEDQPWNLAQPQFFTFGNKLLQAFGAAVYKTQFTTQEQVAQFYDLWAAKIPLAIKWLDALSSDSDKIQDDAPSISNGLNVAQETYLANQYFEWLISNTTNNSEDDPKLIEINTELNAELDKMKQLVALFNKYLITSAISDNKYQNTNGTYQNPDYIFGNGQFYGISNKDHALEWIKDSNIALPQNSQNLFPFLVTLMQVLQVSLPAVPNNLNATTNNDLNIPAAFIPTMLQKPSPYNKFVYDSSKLDLLIASLNELFTKLDGRYQAALHYPEKFANKYFNMGQDANALWSPADVDNFIKSHSDIFNPATFKYQDSNNLNLDASVYQTWNKEFIIPKLQAWAEKNAQYISEQGLKDIAAALKELQDGEMNFYLTEAGQNPSVLNKLQGIHYEVTQINKYKQAYISNIDSANTIYSNLTSAQKQALTTAIKGDNVFTMDKINALDKFFGNTFANVNDVLHNDLSANLNKQSLIQLNEITGKLNSLINTIKTTIFPGTPQETNLLKLATNKDTFMAAYNAVSPSDFAKFNNISPEEVTNLYNELDKQYKALNGYKQELLNDIKNIDPSISSYLTPAKVSEITNVSNVPTNITKEQKDAEYNKILNALKQAVKDKISAEPNLNNAQKQALNSQIDASSVNEFNSLAPIIAKAKELNEAMGNLQDSITAANALKDKYQAIIQQMPQNEALSNFNNELKDATDINPQNQGDGINANVSTVNKQKTNLDNAIKALQTAITTQQIKDVLDKINDKSSPQAQEFKKQTLDWLSKPQSQEDLDNKLAQAQNIVMKDSLQKAINSANEQKPISPELQNAITTANNALNTVKTPSEVQSAVDQLNNAIKRNELVNALNEANKIDPKSPFLQNAIASAQGTLDQNDSAKYQEQINALQNAIKKEPLSKLIDDAGKITGANDNTQLQDAINNANKVRNDLSATPQQIAQAQQDLQNAMNSLSQANDLKKQLQELIDAGKKLPNSLPNNQATYDKAQELVNNPNAQINDLKTQIGIVSQTNTATDLDNTIKQIQAQNPEASKHLQQALSQAQNAYDTAMQQLKDNKVTAESAIKQNQILQDDKNNLLNIAHKEALAKALEQASSIPLPIYPGNREQYNKLQQAIATAASQYQNDDINTTEQTIKQQADKLNTAVDIFHLQQAISVANNDKNKSQGYQNIYDDAQNILNAVKDYNNIDEAQASEALKQILKNAKTPALQAATGSVDDIVKLATSLLHEATTKEPLVNAINKANDVMQLLNNGSIVIPEDQKDHELSVEERKDALQKALDIANNQLAATPLKTKAEYVADADALNKVTTMAEKLLQQLKDLLSQKIADALNINPKNPALENIIKTAQEDVKDPEAKAAKIIEDISQLEKLAAQNKLQNAINTLPEALKNSQSFKDMILNNAQSVANNPNASTSQYEEQLSKLNDAIKKEKLFQAYDNVNSNAIKPLSPELSNEMDKASQMLNDPDGEYTSQDQNFFDTKADELNKALALNNLQNTLNKANSIANPSQTLQDAISQAQKVYDDKNTTTQQINQTQKQLQNALDKENLSDALNKANNILNTLKPDGNISQAQQDLINKLQQAINSANSIHANNDLSKQQYDDAAKALQDVIKSVQQAQNALKDALKDALSKANNINPKSNNLQDAITNATKVLQDPNATYQQMQDALDNLNHRVNSNKLDIAIQNAPSLTSPVQGFTPTLPESQAASNNANISQEDANKQAQIQELNNAQINALNNLNNLKWINNAQKAALQKAIISATTIGDVNTVSQQANALDGAMHDLNKYVATIPESLKANPISNIGYVYADIDKQAAFNKVMQTVNDVINKTNGIVYQNNKASAIGDLQQELTDAINALNGNEIYHNIINNAKNDLNDLNTYPNSNSFYNATKAMQQAYNNQLAQANKLLAEAKKQSSTTNKDLTNALQDAIDKLKALKKDMSQFSDQEFKDNDGIKQPQIDNILNGLNNLSPEQQDKIKNEFNQQTSYADAQKVIQDAINQNNTIASNTNDLNNAINNALNGNSFPQSTIDSLNNALNGLINNGANSNNLKDQQALIDGISKLKNLSDALEQYLNSNVKDSSAYANALENLKNAITSSNDLTASSPTNKALIEAYNNKLNAFKAQANNTINAVTALINKDSNAFNQAISALDNINNKYKAFQEQLASDNYFNIVNKGKNQITRQDVSNIQNLVKSEAFQNIDKVFQSAIISNIKASNSFPWWAWLLIVSALIWSSGMLLILTKK
ncbi:hypothetical protein [Mycoplasma seminis]|uniref:Extracellular matrix-binding protein ebh GA module domain-containing protein n=1 Tax=Mycoplasma seminis TaxID=512749 RepID=A0ABY9HA64_9MOLU|nr:hypothetical protein [Mycoplasma seminis]WLP85391.1 hypothetical protein Q8852_03660 [Mycoplasma seminis]